MAKHRSQGNSSTGYKSEVKNEKLRETEEQIKEQRTTAAGIILEFKTRYPEMASDLSLFRDTIGIVAALATVDNDDLSRTLARYLGKEKMVGIVCRTFGGGVRNMEKYNKAASDTGSTTINTTKGVHGFAASLGMRLHGRFLVICLEQLIPFPGGVVENDPQRRLDLPAPKMPNGETPSGFLGFAVNLLHLENRDLCYVTFEGYGLRETLFYALFSQLHVYKTKDDLHSALPCITHGAVSLDGGMVQKPGIFALGHAEDVAVRFPVVPPSSIFPAAYTEAESKMRRVMWEQLHLASDIRREQLLLTALQAQLSRRY
ncbi:Protein DEFECTIVE IN MERISTEM SILENCING 3 [Linum grandiflorum]